MRETTQNTHKKFPYLNVKKGLLFEGCIKLALEKIGLKHEWNSKNHEGADFTLKNEKVQIEAKNLKANYYLTASWIKRHIIERFKKGYKKIVIFTKAKLTEKAINLLEKAKVKVVILEQRLTNSKKANKIIKKLMMAFKQILGLNNSLNQKRNDSSLSSDMFLDVGRIVCGLFGFVCLADLCGVVDEYLRLKARLEDELKSCSGRERRLYLVLYEKCLRGLLNAIKSEKVEKLEKELEEIKKLLGSKSSPISEIEKSEVENEVKDGAEK